jgi:ABC-type xylose transport system permease subunit
MVVNQSHDRKANSWLRFDIDYKKLGWSVLFAVLVAVLYFSSVHFLDTRYPHPVRPNDLVLDIVPETKSFIVVGELVGAAQGFLTAYGLFRNRLRDLPSFIFQLSFMFMLRSFAIVLTPLAQIQLPEKNFSSEHVIAQSMYKGMFFSGHTGSAFTQFFFEKNSILRRIHFAMAFLQAFSLLASHSHYSIDVFAAFFVAYFVTHFDFRRLVPVPMRKLNWAPWS